MNQRMTFGTCALARPLHNVQTKNVALRVAHLDSFLFGRSERDFSGHFMFAPLLRYGGRDGNGCDQRQEREQQLPAMK